LNIKIEHLYFKYKSLGSSSNYALEDINLEIDEGEFLALVGPSGSGKTTLMQHLTGLLKPDKGRILVDGLDIFSKACSLSQIRRRIGLVFQFPETQLFEETVYADVAFAPCNLGLPETEINLRVKQAMKNVELDFEKYKSRSPIHLSEGEKRRVALAGILAMKPEFLALDEPTAGLDSKGVKAVKKLLKNFHAQGNSVLLISHNLDFVSSLVDRMVLLQGGKICFDGHKRDLFRNNQILDSFGLTLPRTQQVADALKHKGWLSTNELYSVQEIKEELKKNLKTNNKTNKGIMDSLGNSYFLNVFQNKPVDEK
jgi:energy-coupling factor transport system ATP-binding protein